MGGPASVRCRSCRRTFPIDSGILRLLGGDRAMDSESQREQQIRDEHAIVDGLELDWQYSDHQMMEIVPTLGAMAIYEGATVLELGCGNGRYTKLLLEGGARVVAVDFSFEALLRLRDRLGPSDQLVLVHADVTTLRTRQGRFDAVLSTLVSNLPTRRHRDSMYCLAANALTSGGRFVFGTHLQGIRERYLRVEKSGRYPDTGIYRYNFTLRECLMEPKRFFRRVRAQPIQIYLPVLRRLPWSSNYRVSRLLERVPGLNRFGALTVCTATEPITLGESNS